MNKKHVQFLKSYANTCKLFFNLGKDGLSKNFIIMIDNALAANEMVKVKLLKTVEEETKVVAKQLSSSTNSTLVQVVGKTITLYRKSDKNIIQIQ
jgi:RNA-binding protein